MSASTEPPHAHAWVRLPEDPHQFRCACGATGFRRYGMARKIVPHKVPRTNKSNASPRMATEMRNLK